MGYLLGIPLLLVGVVAGAYFPDLDLRLPFLVHRSILTHNAFLPLLLALFFYRRKGPALRLFTVGLGEGLAVHLAFDLFPVAWHGYALISLPFLGRTSPAFSWIWIAASILLCMVIVAALVRRGLDTALAGMGLVAAFAWYATTQHVYVWGELAAVSGAVFLVLAGRAWYGRGVRRRR